jgi:hypothetical protein
MPDKTRIRNQTGHANDVHINGDCIEVGKGMQN